MTLNVKEVPPLVTTGVPDITPVLELIVMPLGKAPVEIANE